MISSVRNIFRLFGIARTLARYDALFPLETAEIAPGLVRAAKLLARKETAGRPGERLAAALQELGPSFIKLGQALSTRSDLFGEIFTADLATLQDRLPPFPGVQARATVEAELGRPLEECFREFDDTPVAAASIAQVHFAITAQGEEVAVRCCALESRKLSPPTSPCSIGWLACPCAGAPRCDGSSRWKR